MNIVNPSTTSAYKARLYTPETPQLHCDHVLSGSEHHYANKVLRLGAGDRVALICGNGNNYAADVRQVTRKETVVAIRGVEPNDCGPSYPLILCVALLKGEPMDRVLQKSVELGVSAIQPLNTEHSERRVSAERWEKKYAHWQGILIASALQCGRAEWPVLNAPVAFAKGIEVRADQRWIFTPHHASEQRTNQNMDSVAVLIGPEGGFSDREADLAMAAGWQPRCFGKRILRADTAAIAALVSAHQTTGRW